MPVKELLRKFTKAQLRAALAESPYVNTASGWKVDSTGDVRPGDPESPEARATRIAGLAGVALGQSLVSGMGLMRAYPALARAVDVAGSVDGIRNLVSDNGIKKTAGLVREGKYGRAALSGLGDVFDLAGTADAARMAGKIANRAYRGYHTFNVLSPYSYDNPGKRGKEIMKSMLLERKYDEPIWKNSPETNYFLGQFKFDRDRNIARAVREDALALYTGQPLRNNTYIRNADGSYSFNLDEIQKIGGDPLIGVAGARDYNYDAIGHTHGGLWSSRTRDALAYPQVFSGTDGKQYTYKTLHIEDLWDLQPFSRETDLLLTKRLNKKLKDSFGSDVLRGKIGDFRKYMFDKGHWDLGIGAKRGRTLLGKMTLPLERPSNILRSGIASTKKGPVFIPEISSNIIDFLTNNKVTRHIDDKLRSFEAGKILGGKPFLMKTDVPYTEVIDPKEFISHNGVRLTGIEDPLRYIPGIENHYGYIDVPGYVNPMKGSRVSGYPNILQSSSSVGIKGNYTYPEGGLLLRDYRNGGKIKTDNTGKSWWQNTLNYFVGGERGLLESLYRPTRGDVGERYYTRDGLKNDVVLNLLGGSKAEERTDLGSKKYYSDFNEAYDSLSALNRTGISGSRNAGNATLGTYGVSAGSDDRGRYISFADKYDYRVLPMILPKLLHPFHIYDRIYEDEWDNIASQVSQSDPEAGNFWLAPQVQTGDTGIYKSGGKIHIKPENRGKFTALKKRTGHSASWFKAHGTPAQKKMAVFALNARKWKHGDGGLIERMQSVYGDDIAAMREAIQLAKSKK